MNLETIKTGTVIYAEVQLRRRAKFTTCNFTNGNGLVSSLKFLCGLNEYGSVLFRVLKEQT